MIVTYNWKTKNLWHLIVNIKKCLYKLIYKETLSDIGKGIFKKGNYLWATLFNYHQNIFYMHYPSDKNAHTMAFVITFMEHWLEQEIAQWVHHERSI